MHLGEAAFVLQVLTTFAMTGLIWFVQVVHYPLFGLVVDPQHSEYARVHQGRTGWVVGPTMLLELGTALLLVVPGMRPARVGFGEALVGLGLLVVVWASTGLLQVPLHGRLLRGLDEAVVRRLVGTNWIRTVAWSLRSVLVGYWLLRRM
jgi:hypothetical protein